MKTEASVDRANESPPSPSGSTIPDGQRALSPERFDAVETATHAGSAAHADRLTASDLAFLFQGLLGSQDES